MRYAICLVAVLFISGCTGGTWYPPPPSGATARSRVVSLAPGNTELTAPSSLTCKADFSRKLGWFHPDGDQSIQANRRGFNRRVGMPGGSDFPSHLYAEQIIDAGQPLYLHASNIASGGGGVIASPGIFLPSLSFCNATVGFSVHEGRDYEAVFQRSPEGCVIAFYELHLESNGSVKRNPIMQDLGEKKC